VVLVAALDALSSQLPGHAARSVATSLCRWSTSSAEQEPATIELQVVLWRAVLIGEKRGTELLEPEDYLKAARELEKRFTQRALSSKWLWVVAALAAGLFVAGLVILVASHGHAGRVAAGASGVLAALGLTWKGIGGTIGKLVAKLEAPLWGAELDAAITDVITLSSTPHVTSQGKHAGLAYADRRGRARAATQPPAAPASQSSAGRPA
jgi:hypothetical protein